MPDASVPQPNAADIHLSPDEAVVLFELLARWCYPKAAQTPGSACFESTAECAVLHGVLADLERQLVAPFRGDYDRIVKEARSRLAGRWDGSTLQG
jgi:hypothetical protein